MKPVHYDIRGPWDRIMGYHSLACGRTAPRDGKWRTSCDPAEVTCKKCRKTTTWRHWERNQGRRGGA